MAYCLQFYGNFLLQNSFIVFQAGYLFFNQKAIHNAIKRFTNGPITYKELVLINENTPMATAMASSNYIQ